jgi:excisionase family DNA binding protein
MADASEKRNKKMNETHPPQPDARQLERLAAFLRLLPENGPLDRLLKGAAHLETPATTAAELAGDILHGAATISRFVYGDERQRRKVYRLVKGGKLPHFRLGNSICSRKSALLEWVERQEQGEK